MALHIYAEICGIIDRFLLFGTGMGSCTVGLEIGCGLRFGHGVCLCINELGEPQPSPVTSRTSAPPFFRSSSGVQCFAQHDTQVTRTRSRKLAQFRMNVRSPPVYYAALLDKSYVNKALQRSFKGSTLTSPIPYETCLLHNSL